MATYKTRRAIHKLSDNSGNEEIVNTRKLIAELPLAAMWHF